MTIVDFKEVVPQGRIIAAPSLTVTLPSSPVRYFRHGWQSWSLAAWTGANEVFPIQKPRLLYPLQVDPVYAGHPHPHGSWVGAVEIKEGVLIMGALGLDAHVELKDGELRGWYDAGAGDWFIACGTELSVFSRYAAALGERWGVSGTGNAPRVWCSWYSLHTAIDAQVIRRANEELGDLPFDVLQVDDGWQVSVGDWEANGKFPDGMAALAEAIRSKGRKAGLWLAPLIAVKSSALFRRHPDWFLRDERGRLVSAGFNWGEPLYAVDTGHPDALLWLAALMKKVCGWGFDYLKLDFLYGGALPGKRRGTISRETAYRNALMVMRSAMGGNTFFLACGAPILPSLGICDALRIGPDVADGWESARDAMLFSNPTMPGVKNAMRTTLHRLWLGSIVQIDPDAAYFGSRDCSLSGEEKSLLQGLALVCRFRATSDLPWRLTEKEREALRAFLVETPSVERRDCCTFRIGSRDVDFTSALSLPEPPRGLTALKGVLLGWLGNRALAMKINNALNENAWKKTRMNVTP
jgi:alpha-galactosidase